MPKFHFGDEFLFDATRLGEEPMVLSAEVLSSAADLTKFTYFTALELIKLIRYGACIGHLESQKDRFTRKAVIKGSSIPESGNWTEATDFDVELVNKMKKVLQPVAR